MKSSIDYWRRVILKVFCFGVFGIGALILGSVGFPFLSLIMSGRDQARSRRSIRALMSRSFSLFTWLMSVLGLIRVEFRPGDREKLRRAKGVIVVANHPSLIDVVILVGCMPQADCIVKSRLFTTPFVRWVVGRIYIPNSLSFDEITNRCRASLEEGNSLVIFPEGTRTAKESSPRFKRGAAHIALRTGHDLLPIVIEADNPMGLQKGDPLFSMSRQGPIRYHISVHLPIDVSLLDGVTPVLAARSLTRALVDVINNKV